ncbi:hypothetical protein PTW35_13870 [Photobacterium sp. DA100]|uniref:hypothetical protein n=1 Tax=Photobacterium sp. DA100 TaxID=3027472 RepID=UPI00247B0D3D|nr:hypothetical protein [Photobacterium sp. DA100]WEM41696.1 hypothetical protein PTW35_13870 [Photobacterium sp. DA100]
MRYVLCLCASLLFSSSVLAFGSGGSLGANPGEASGAVNAKTPLCLDASGERIPDSYQIKYQRQCEITGNTMVDIINYNNYYRNKPSGESLSDIKTKAS